jgi:hypothetical protein
MGSIWACLGAFWGGFETVGAENLLMPKMVLGLFGNSVFVRTERTARWVFVGSAPRSFVDGT